MLLYLPFGKRRKRLAIFAFVDHYARLHSYMSDMSEILTGKSRRGEKQ